MNDRDDDRDDRRRDDDDDDRPRRRRRRDDDDDFDDDRPRRRRREEDFDAAGLIVPIGASPLSLAACYLGLIGVCLVPLAPIALVCGILAVRRRKRSNPNSYAGVTSDVRAWIGIGLGALGTLFLVAGVTVFILTQMGVMK